METLNQIKEKETHFCELSIDLLVGMRDMLLLDQEVCSVAEHEIIYSTGTAYNISSNVVSAGAVSVSMVHNFNIYILLFCSTIRICFVTGNVFSTLYLYSMEALMKLILKN